jgi:hypothetical protein
MKKVFVAFVAVFGLLFLFSSDSIKEGEINPIGTPAKALTITERQYLWGLHSFHENRIEAVSDENLIIAGQNACSFLDEGYPIPNVVIDLVYTEESLNKDKILANEVIANAVFTMCKEFIPLVNNSNP